MDTCRDGHLQPEVIQGPRGELVYVGGGSVRGQVMIGVLSVTGRIIWFSIQVAGVATVVYLYGCFYVVCVVCQGLLGLLF